jgi:hypothetical protein
MQLPDVISLIVEESAGQVGLKRFSEDAASALPNIPRCQELLGFFLSEKYQRAQEAVGFDIRGTGGHE